MARRNIRELEKVEPRESLYSLDELIDLCSRKPMNDNGSTDSDLLEVTLCLANEIKKLKVEARGISLALEQAIAKGKITTEESRRTKT